MKKSNLIYSKIPQKGICIFVFISSFFNTFYAQKYTEVPTSGEFTPDIEDVENMEYGINLYDQYATYKKDARQRLENDTVPLEGKQEDYYGKNSLLHKGFYNNGYLRSYSNYYHNESLERKYKYKGEGTGTLEVYYLNGYFRTIQMYFEYEPYYWEDYYENGVMAYQEIRNKKTGKLEIMRENNFYGKTISKIEKAFQDSKSNIYIMSEYDAKGKPIQEGEVVYLPAINDYRKDGLWVTYDVNGETNSKVEYANGEMVEILEDNREEKEKVYGDLDPWFAQDIEDGHAETIDKGEAALMEKAAKHSKLPEHLIRFDRNSDDYIEVMELDLAVSNFFEDETIELSQINDLVNFFFDQY